MLGKEWLVKFVRQPMGVTPRDLIKRTGYSPQRLEDHFLSLNQRLRNWFGDGFGFEKGPDGEIMQVTRLRLPRYESNSPNKCPYRDCTGNGCTLVYGGSHVIPAYATTPNGSNMGRCHAENGREAGVCSRLDGSVYWIRLDDLTGIVVDLGDDRAWLREAAWKKRN